jgi:agmatinase
LPVLIGGDASTAATVIEVMQRSGPLDVIRIGRPAYGPQTGTVNLLTAASLPAHVLSMPFVGRYVHVVPRGSEMAGMKLPGKYARISVDAALAMDKGPLDQGGNDRRRVHVGIDVDALAQASDGASCASFAYRDVHALLGAIGRTCRIASIDLCGVNPSAPCWGAVSMTGLHLLLTALSAAKDPA